MGIVACGTGNGPLVIKGKVLGSTALGTHIDRMRHAVDDRMAVPAHGNDILDKTPTRLDRPGLVTVKAPGGLIHEGVGVLRRLGL